jgi:hypothetical protein
MLSATTIVSSCVKTTGQNSVYIVLDPREAAQFLELAGTLSERSKLTPHFGKLQESDGSTFNTLESTGRKVTLWLQNVPLSGYEDKSLCGDHARPHSDPAQFVMYVEPRFFWVGQEEADKVQAQITASLDAAGYDIRSEPAVCGNAVLRMSEP